MLRRLLPLSLLPVVSAMAEPVFEGLGFTGFMNDISADGSQIGGVFFPAASNSNTTAYRWNAATGVQNLGLFPGSSLSANSSYTRSLSLNANTVVGYGRTSSASGERAFRWDGGIGYTLLPNPSGYSSASATTVSADGSVVFGQSFQSTGIFRYEATRWTGSGVTTLGTLPGYTSSFIHDVSADGTAAAGGSGGSGGAFIWTQANGIQPIPGVAVTKAISADGAYVVGTTTNYPGSQAYRWSAATGVVQLGVLDDEHPDSTATDVSADGSIVVGYSYGDSGSTPFIWSSATGMLDLRDVIAANGGSSIGWSLYTNGVLQISDNGLTIAGNGVGPNSFNEVWIARLSTINLSTIPEPAAAGPLMACLAGAFVVLRRDFRRRQSPARWTPSSR